MSRTDPVDVTGLPSGVTNPPEELVEHPVAEVRLVQGKHCVADNSTFASR
jgi:hypothetical protein